MKTIYKEGNIFKSNKARSFKVIATGKETISFFEAYKENRYGKKEYRSYLKDAFELEIPLSDKQKEVKQKLIKFSNNLKEIANSIEKMNDSDIVSSIGGNISLLNLLIDKNYENNKI